MKYETQMVSETGKSALRGIQETLSQIDKALNSTGEGSVDGVAPSYVGAIVSSVASVASVMAVHLDVMIKIHDQLDEMNQREHKKAHPSLEGP